MSYPPDIIAGMNSNLPASTNEVSLTAASGESNEAYQRIPVLQGTAEWREWRQHGIGASDAATIMGENPYKSAERLMAEKLGQVADPVRNRSMALGLELEPAARYDYCRSREIALAPACLQSTQVSWLRASLDGLSRNGRHVIEIKCGYCTYRYTRRMGQPPSYYKAQLQHVLAVTELETIDFVCYRPNIEPLCLTIERDDAYIAMLLCRENAFWERLRRYRDK